MRAASSSPVRSASAAINIPGAAAAASDPLKAGGHFSIGSTSPKDDTRWCIVKCEHYHTCGSSFPLSLKPPTSFAKTRKRRQLRYEFVTVSWHVCAFGPFRQALH